MRTRQGEARRCTGNPPRTLIRCYWCLKRGTGSLARRGDRPTTRFWGCFAWNSIYLLSGSQHIGSKSLHFRKESIVVSFIAPRKSSSGLGHFRCGSQLPTRGPCSCLNNRCSCLNPKRRAGCFLHFVSLAKFIGRALAATFHRFRNGPVQSAGGPRRRAELPGGEVCCFMIRDSRC